MSYITFNGGNSEDYYLSLESGLTFTSASRDIDFVKVPGVDGEVATGDGTLKNTSRSFPFRLRLPLGMMVEESVTDISNWLKKDNLWHELYFDGDPDYIYMAMYHDSFDIDRIVSWYGKLVLEFTVKPYKFLQRGLREIDLANEITNIGTRPARPKIILRGSGIMTLEIGSEKFTAKNVDGGIIIDTLYQTATDLSGNRAIWDNVTSYPLPTIPLGKSAVRKSASITSATIVPRWEVIV